MLCAIFGGVISGSGSGLTIRFGGEMDGIEVMAVIVTRHPQQISRALCDVFGKGVTILSAHGYYSQEKKTVIYFVVNRFQIARLRHIVRTIDKHAFVSVAEVSDLE